MLLKLGCGKGMCEFSFSFLLRNGMCEFELYFWLKYGQLDYTFICGKFNFSIINYYIVYTQPLKLSNYTIGLPKVITLF